MNLKELQQLIKLCQKNGIESIKYDGIELVFGIMPSKDIINKRQQKRYQVPGLLTEDTKIVTSESWDDLTPEQQIFYSSIPEATEQHPY